MLLLQRKPHGIMTGIGYIGQPVAHAKRKENRGVGSHRDAGVTLFNLIESHPANGGPLRQDRNGNTPPPAGVTNIVPELAQRTGYRYGCPRR